MRKINCVYNDSAWCKNINIKKSFIFFGARVCKIFSKEETLCPYRKEITKPNPPPAPPYKKLTS